MKVYGEDCSTYLQKKNLRQKRGDSVLNETGMAWGITFFYMSEFSVTDALSLVYH